MSWEYIHDDVCQAAQLDSIAGVLRYLGIRRSGGSYHHIKRAARRVEHRHDAFHGPRPHQGRTAPNRLTPEQVLVVRPMHQRRAPGSLLTKALVAVGTPPCCASCGMGPQWNSLPLVLHVDHINGDYSDCRQANLRFLCPNCHSQTDTFAGRGKRPEERRLAKRIRVPVAAPAETPMTVGQAARLLGCSPSQFYRIRTELDRSREAGEERARKATKRADRIAAVIACALAFPDEGPRKIAARLLTDAHGGGAVSHGTVSNVLRAAGLIRAIQTERARRIPGRCGYDVAPYTRRE